MGRILEGKFGDEKKVEKRRVKEMASEGHAMAGREGFGKGKWVGRAKFGTPRPMGMGGRIVYASRIPPRPHEALRVGDFAEGRGRCLEQSRSLYHCNIGILNIEVLKYCNSSYCNN